MRRTLFRIWLAETSQTIWLKLTRRSLERGKTLILHTLIFVRVHCFRTHTMMCWTLNHFIFFLLLQPEEQDLGQWVQVGYQTWSILSRFVNNIEPSGSLLCPVLRLKRLLSMQIRWILVRRQEFSAVVPHGWNRWCDRWAEETLPSGESKRCHYSIILLRLYTRKAQ